MTEQMQEKILLKVFLAIAIAFSSFMTMRYIFREDKIYRIDRRMKNIEDEIRKKENFETVGKLEKAENNKTELQVGQVGQTITDQQVEINTIMYTLNRYFADHGIEETLVNVILRVDENKCENCTQQDKETILQVKMMNFLRQGNIKEATKILNKIGKSNASQNKHIK